MSQAADTNLDEELSIKKKPYITKKAWDQIEYRNELCKHRDSKEKIKQLSRDIAKDAAQDRKQSIIEQFNENPSDENKKHLWKSVKDQKRKFSPQFIKMKNKEGNHVPLTKRAEAIAEYLEQDHWNNTTDTGNPVTDAILEPNCANENPFDGEELNDALRLTKNNKQPGPDDVIMELLKWLDRDKRDKLLSSINDWWINKNAPDWLFLARIVPIYKKGDTDKASI